MKKLLIATAALAMVAGTAQAQSSVTVYGIIDTGYNSLEDKTSGTGAKTTEVSGIQGGKGEASSSRLGFRGTEDLGGGLKANFQIESGIAQNETAPKIGDRFFWVGLEDAKLGQLRIGRQDTVTRSNWLAHDQLAFANVAGNLAHDGNGSGAAKTSHTNRSNAVNYISPRFNGVQLTVGMTQADTESTGQAKTKAGSGSQVGLNYAAGNFSAGVAYVESVTSTANTVANGGALLTDGKSKDTSFAASYDLGFTKVAYIYNKREVVDRVAPTSTDEAKNSNRESNAFSASFPLTPKLVGRLGYGYGEYKAGGAAAGYTGDIKGYQAALNYNLSKRTTVYGIYGNEKRDISTSSDIESKEYSVGVRHSF